MVQRPRGRPTRLTEEVVLVILEALELGASDTQACDAAGINPTTFINWKNRGEKEQERLDALIASGTEDPEPQENELPFLDLIKRISTARWNASRDALASIKTAQREGNWNAAAWWLERKHPQEFGKAQVLTHQGPNGGPIQTNTSVRIQMIEVRKKYEDGGEFDDSSSNAPTSS